MKGPKIQQRIGEAVRRHRKGLGFSQEAFADKIHMHRAYYGALERGEKNIQVSTLERVCFGLGVAVYEVVRDSD